MDNNKIAFITGSTDGIVKATALKLLKEGWEVVINGRSDSKCEATINELKHKSGNSNVTALIADLANLSQVKSATEKFLETHSRLDLLMLNANAIAYNRILTVEGNEQNFALGYLSRVLMIRKLEKLLENTTNSQILSVIGMDTQPLDFKDPAIENNFTGRKGLGRWQWAMNLFSSEYNKTSKVPLNLYMPGLVKTKVLANEPQPMRAFVRLMNFNMGLTPEQSADNVVIVINDIVSHKKKGTCYSWKKERGVPKIKMTEGDNLKLIKLTNDLLNKY
jgi:NAD(P)-dependent dehydrogenase (short-subunit alcohol dehydrogenase family)